MKPTQTLKLFLRCYYSASKVTYFKDELAAFPKNYKKKILAKRRKDNKERNNFNDFVAAKLFTKYYKFLSRKFFDFFG